MSDGKSLDSGEMKGAISGGVIATVALFATGVGVGQVHSFEALNLINAIQPGARFLGSTAIGAGLTVLALLLTLIGLTISADFSFHQRLFGRAKNITRLGVASIVTGVVLLLAVGVPVEEVDEIAQYYSLLYYILTACMALVGGLLVSMGLLIGSTLNGLIRAKHPEADSELTLTTSDDEDVDEDAASA